MDYFPGDTEGEGRVFKLTPAEAQHIAKWISSSYDELRIIVEHKKIAFNIGTFSLSIKA